MSIDGSSEHGRLAEFQVKRKVLIGAQNAVPVFEDSSGRYVATYNAWASFFGVFWYMRYGMLLKGLAYFGASLLFIFLCMYVMAPEWVYTALAGLWWTAYGMMANYDHYLKHHQSQNWWPAARFGPLTQNPLFVVLLAAFILTGLGYAAGGPLDCRSRETQSRVAEVLSEQRYPGVTVSPLFEIHSLTAEQPNQQSCTSSAIVTYSDGAMGFLTLSYTITLEDRWTTAYSLEVTATPWE